MDKAAVKVESSNVRNVVEKQVEKKARGKKRRAQKSKFVQQKSSNWWKDSQNIACFLPSYTVPKFQLTLLKSNCVAGIGAVVWYVL